MIAFMRLLLPAPFGPRSTVTWPAGQSMFTSRTTSGPPGWRTDTFRSDSPVIMRASPGASVRTGASKK